MTSPNYSQQAFRWRNDDGTLEGSGSATWAGASNAGVTLEPDTTYNLVINFENTNDKAGNDGYEIFQQWAGAGGYTQITTSSSNIVAITGGITDGSAFTTNILPNGGGAAFSPGQHSTDGVTGVYSISASNQSIVQFALQVVASDIGSGGQSASLRLYDDAGNPINNYNVNAILTSGSPPPAASLFHKGLWFRYDRDALNSGSTWIGASNSASYAVDLEIPLLRSRWEVESNTSQTANFKTQFLHPYSGGTWVDPQAFEEGVSTSTSLINSWTPTFYDDLATTTDVLTGASTSFVTGRGAGSPNATGNITFTAGVTHTEVEFAHRIRTFADAQQTLPDGASVGIRLYNTSKSASVPGASATLVMDWGAYRLGGTAPENPNRIGPFISSCGTYYLLSEPSEIDPQFMVIKSGSDGAEANTGGWTIVASATAPAATDLEGLDAIVEDGVIHILHNGGGGGGVKFHKFNMDMSASDPDTWALIDQTVQATITELDQLAALGLRGGSYIGLWSETSGTDNLYGASSADGTTWSTRETVETGGELLQAMIVKDHYDSASPFYVIYSDSGNGLLRVRKGTDLATIISSTASTIATGLGTATSDRKPIVPNPYLYNSGSGGDSQIYIAYKDSSDTISGILATAGSAPSYGSASVITASITMVNVLGMNTRMPVAFMAGEGASVHLMYSPDQTSGCGIYHNSKVITDSWDAAETAVLTGSGEGTTLVGQVAVRGGNTYLAYAWENNAGWLKEYLAGASHGGQPGYGFWGEYAITASVAGATPITASYVAWADLQKTASASFDLYATKQKTASANYTTWSRLSTTASAPVTIWSDLQKTASATTTVWAGLSGGSSTASATHIIYTRLGSVGQIPGAMVQYANRVGPYSEGNSLYTVMVQGRDNEDTLRVMRSVDSGSTWDEVDGTNRPVSGSVLSIDTEYSASVIHIAAHSGTSVWYHTFSTATNGWDVTDESVSGCITASLPSVALNKRSDSTLVCYYRSTDSGEKIKYIIRSAASSWGASANLNGTNGNETWVMAVTGASDISHAFYIDNTGGCALYNYLTLINSLSPPTVIASTIGTDNTDTNPIAAGLSLSGSDIYLHYGSQGDSGSSDSMALANPVQWTSGASNNVMIGYKKSVDDKLYTKIIEVT